ncbi:hypothetical protein Ae168Ps1_3605c [Pseudonocardia sp. Ae168_Ps1]|uniref:hypothetical protein n=1 Tax=unclassified Pseudonocardia TaxID=2619320 RepID=UPI00094B7508|nr:MULTISPECIES: hypothetical protein [unclassified Pseudonocardia]OLL75205.1 hypothetical protein Ae150APs1_3583c [Pseudonocardia sp. Ae150A_Ps1]OLL81199.1 hypothetical protein Ae168Ps1_3605c [Pseudonocardia sp. Ae168_Ps1]OLL84686.1 hypothetical protein Ae263Ps1_1741 [Pseudonocardia sp. Ae263_Ps1]OLL95297.1 hypothetical protein Ae356Ps1_5194c [Pseudonocardia sp. Ae356_Ps1]
MLRRSRRGAERDRDATSPSPRSRLLLLTAALVTLAVGLWACWSVTVDDAYITYRYSANLALGHGPTWNPGENPVEGYTNFLWMLWHVPWVWAGASLPVVSKLTAAACAGAIVWILVSEPRTRTGAAAAAGAFVLFLPTWVHVDAGLETAPFALVVLRSVVLVCRLLRDRTAYIRSWELPALLLVAGMLRPDGILAVAPPLLVWAFLRRAERRTWIWLVGGAVVGGAYTAWRWTYFGHPLPNTFYVKVGVEAATDLRWATTTVVLLLPLLLLTVSGLTRRPTAGPAALLVASCAALYLIPALTAPAMDYLSRFAWHGLPLLCLGAAWTLDGIARRRLAVFVALITVAWTCTAGSLHRDGPTMVNYGEDLRRAHIAIGQGLADAGLPEARRSVAMTDAGAIPYFSGWRATDYIGLNDERIGHGASATEVLLADAPSVIVATGPGPELPATSWATDLPRAVGDRELVAVVRVRPTYFEQVYADRDVAQQVRSAVQRRLVEADADTDARFDQTYDRWLDRLSGQNVSR